MAQGQGQYQTQSLSQQQMQTLSPQQLLQVKILELTTPELQERIRLEMADNPALEAKEDATHNISENYEEQNHEEAIENEDFEDNETNTEEAQERREALNDVLQSIVQDDEDGFGQNSTRDENEGNYIPYGEIESFYDVLLEQIHEYDLNEDERQIMEYLIGNLDTDGYLRCDIDSLSEELAIYHGIETTQEKIEKVLNILQEFDPAGIGARNLQECLLLQIKRSSAPTAKLMSEIIEKHFEEFKLKHWAKIQKNLGLDTQTGELVFHELTRLNPKPGLAMGDVIGRSIEHVTPDFIVDTHDDGTISFWLNSIGMPELTVEPMMEKMANEPTGKQHSKQQQEAYAYARAKVTEAKNFITAIQQRRQTMYKTMKTIIERQHTFFVDGDEASLKPMKLKDISERTGLDISTISRVNNSKYVQTRWGIFPLKYFFTNQMMNAEGEEVSTRAIKQMLKDIIDSENKKKPFSDDAIAKIMKDKGFPVARRTVAKYREQMGLPVARLRK